jgi:hypothetical protein
MRFVDCNPEERHVVAAAAAKVREVAASGLEPYAGDGRILISSDDTAVFDRVALGVAALKASGRVVSVPSVVSVMLGLGRALRECPTAPRGSEPEGD